MHIVCTCLLDANISNEISENQKYHPIERDIHTLKILLLVCRLV